MGVLGIPQLVCGHHGRPRAALDQAGRCDGSIDGCSRRAFQHMHTDPNCRIEPDLQWAASGSASVHGRATRSTLLHVSALCEPQSTCSVWRTGHNPAAGPPRRSGAHHPLTAPLWAGVRPGRRQTTSNSRFKVVPATVRAAAVMGGGLNGRVPPPLAGSTAPTLTPASGKR